MFRIKLIIEVMNSIKNYLLLASIIIASVGCSNNVDKVVESPDGNIQVLFMLNEEGTPVYEVDYKNGSAVKKSKMGFDLKDQPDMLNGFSVISTSQQSVSDTWEMPWGEKRVVKNNYNELVINLEETKAPNRLLNIIFKVYDSGLGFRYEFPEQKNMNKVFISEENTEFNLAGDHKTFWIPGDWDIYEYLYNTTPISGIDVSKCKNGIKLPQTHIVNNSVNTPVTMITEKGVHLSFHEANLTDYAGMTMKVDTANYSFTSCLVGSDNRDYKVEQKVPFVTPWRTIQISDDAAGLIESDLIVNLNEPNVLGDISWFKPMKYVGIWWDMHLGTKTWDYASSVNSKIGSIKGSSHGATTEYTKELIDFAAEHNIGGVLVEGWNTGWEHWIGFDDREGIFDFVTPYPDYDIKELARYGKEKGVEIIMHHETSSAIKTYKTQMDTAFAFMQSLGMHSVKTGHVGPILPKGEYHHGQFMVNHFQDVLETSAKYEIAINAHEPIKPTGKRRTYPNAISREAVRGQENNAWAEDGGNPPEHLPIVAFTRMLAGPIDFTPGIFNIKLGSYRPDNQVNTTLTKQLALYVVINSPIQMAADLISNYENQPAFKFIDDVAVNWEQTKVLNGEVGEFVTIARQERGAENWFIGGITNEVSRDMELNLNFLTEGKSYNAIVYKDGKNAHWYNNPTDVEIVKIKVTNSTVLPVHLAAGGGFAISVIAE